MAIAVVQSAQSAGAANSSTGTLGVTATSGNLLVSCFSQSSTLTPSIAAGGWTISATKAIYNGSADSVWVAYKISAGTEGSVVWTGGSTGHGCCIWEVSGAANPFALDGSPSSTDNLSASTGSITMTTSVAGSIILMGVGGNVSSGAISAWTGTNVATNISAAASRCHGGSFITTTTVSSAFTANWATSRAAGIIGIMFQPPGVTPSIASGSTLMSLGVG